MVSSRVALLFLNTICFGIQSGLFDFPEPLV